MGKLTGMFADQDYAIHEVSREEHKTLRSLRFRIIRELETGPVSIALDRLCASGLRGDIPPAHVIKLVEGKLSGLSVLNSEDGWYK